MKKVRAVERNERFRYSYPTYPATVAKNGRVSVFSRSLRGSDDFTTTPEKYATLKDAMEKWHLYDPAPIHGVAWKTEN